MTNSAALPNGTELVGDYRVERVLGAGGFGITYLAEEKSLARRVTIKEYFPLDFAARDNAEDVVPRSQNSEPDYKWGLERFLEEAQTLARFNHPNIVRVYRYFRSRKTGYIVLHFEEGQSLKGWLKSLGRAPRQQELDRIVTPLLDALEVIHNADYLHRDIAPDNIIIRTDGSPVLIDFGSARGDIAKHTKTLSALVKPGYSPYEQYATTSNAQGPWTDIYSLAATLYHGMTGKRPPDAPSRMVADEMIPVRDAALSSYRPSFLAAIDRALSLEVGDRPKSIAIWRQQLLEAVQKPARASAKARVAPDTSPVAAPDVDPVAAAPAAPPPPPEPPPPSMRPLPLPEPAKPKRQKREKKPGEKGVVGAFLDGWRKGAPARPANSPANPARADAVPKELNTPAEPRVATVAAAQSAAPQNAQAYVTAHEAAAGSRKATPRAIRSRPEWRWPGVALKAVVGAGIAAGVVSLQDRLPSVRSEGSTTVLSQTGDTVPLGQFKGHRGAVNALVFSADGSQIVTTAADATLKIWNAANRALVRTIELDNGAATSLAIHDRRAVTGHRDGTIVLWDIDRASKLQTFRRNEQAVWSVAFLDDGGRIVASGHDSVLSVWDVKSPAQPVHLLEGHESAAQAVAVSSRSGHIASGGADKTVKLWKSDSASLVRTYRGHTDFVTALAFAPDGRRLASASLDGQIRIWSTMSNRLHYTLRGHQGRIGALAFSPDGELVASASDDGSVRLWSIKQARSVRTLHPHTGEMRTVGFTPDGRRIAAAGIDGLVRLYNATVPKPGT